MDAHSPEILLVEDNPADATMVQEGFKLSRLRPHFVVTASGEAAINYLSGIDVNPPSRPPDFVFLDLDLPMIDGYGVLEHIATDADLRVVETIILSGHVLTESRLGSYCSQVSHIFGKPFNRAGYGEIVRAVELDWAEKVHAHHGTRPVAQGG